MAYKPRLLELGSVYKASSMAYESRHHVRMTYKSRHHVRLGLHVGLEGYKACSVAYKPRRAVRYGSKANSMA